MTDDEQRQLDIIGYNLSRLLKQLETSNMVQRMPDGKFRVKEAEDAEV